MKVVRFPIPCLQVVQGTKSRLLPSDTFAPLLYRAAWERALGVAPEIEVLSVTLSSAFTAFTFHLAESIPARPAVEDLSLDRPKLIKYIRRVSRTVEVKRQRYTKLSNTVWNSILIWQIYVFIVCFLVTTELN